MTWFHASPNEMAEGTALVPGGPDGEHTSSEFYGLGFGDDEGFLVGMGAPRASHVWLSPNLADAAFWAMALSAPHIYEVEPDDEPRPWNGTGTDGWVCSGGRIKCHVEIPRERR